MAADPQQRLPDLEQTLARAGGGVEDAVAQEIVSDAIGPLLDVGVALSRGELSRADVEPVVQRTHAQLESLRGGIVAYTIESASYLLAEIVFPDRWRAACEARSGLQFAIELYFEGGTPEWLAPDLEWFDDVLEGVANRDAPMTPDEIPAGIPERHWWWWAPYRPRPQT